ncbi:MAG: putative prokaryotic signal transducing protein [Candidatus Nomurabacteria bacterium]|nr:putative prokaryotic signal transducing protein [Candidatus Nomurabacteria bacterium]
MIKLIETGDEGGALYIKGLLESQGMKVVISSSNNSYMPGVMGVYNGMVPYDVYIRDTDIEKAKEILKENNI